MGKELPSHNHVPHINRQLDEGRAGLRSKILVLSVQPSNSQTLVLKKKKKKSMIINSENIITLASTMINLGIDKT